MMEICVIIPVYNAASFVTQAVESAVSQPETAEVILIEDGSSDDSLAVCQKLAKTYNNVRLLRHPGGKNKGAGASRNLGMKHTKYDYIAFLDADDYFLPGRFKVAKEIFSTDQTCEGVYENFRAVFEDNSSYKRWCSLRKPGERTNTNFVNVPPEELGTALISGKVNRLIINSLVFKKDVLKKTGLMNEQLILHQDTDFIIKLAIASKLLPGMHEDPVAVYRFHSQNRFVMSRSNSEKARHRIKLWFSLYQWCTKNTSGEIKELTLEHLIAYISKKKVITRFPTRFFSADFLVRNRLLFFSLSHPYMLKETIFRKSIIHPDSLNTTQSTTEQTNLIDE